MPERDWHKDWELTERATLGPWTAVLLNDLTDSTYVEGCEFGSCRFFPPSHYTAELQEQIHNDARFIAEAREALPYWLKRVKELEAQLEWCKWAEECPKSKHGLPQRVQELETQLAEVQEALRELVNSPVTLDDERLDYVEMQVCRAALEDAQKLLRGDRDAAGLD